MKKNRVEMLLERTFLFDPNVYMTIVMTLEGDVSVEEISEAVKKMYTQNSMTMSKAVLDEQGTFFMEEMDETGCKVFVDERDWQEIMRENERRPFHIEEGELVRTFIIPKGKEIDIYFMVHHVTCDGNGILLMAEDVLSNLQGKEVAYRTSKVMTKKGVIRKGDLKFVERLALKGLSKKWGKERQVYNWDDYFKTHETFWKDRHTEIMFKEVDGVDMTSLKDECKKHGVTVNSYLVAKLMEKYPEYKVLGIPTSIRGEDRSISCMISSVILTAEYDGQKSFEENLVVIDATIKKALRDPRAVYHVPQFVALSDPTLLDAGYMQHVLGFENEIADSMRRVLGLYGARRTELGVTNLGVLSIPSDYDRFKITRIIPVAPCISTAENVYTVSTYNGKMLIAKSYIKGNEE